MVEINAQARLVRPGMLEPVARTDRQTAPLKTDAVASGADSAGDVVQISGESLIRARLGHGAALPYLTPETAGSYNSTYSFLTADDRAVIGGLYEETQRVGGDLRQVDALAFDLGAYRSRPSGAYGDSVGTLFNQDGTPVVIELDPEEEKIAQRILTSQALNSTSLPQPFLRTVLDPGLQYGHAVDFAFLEKVVYATASSGKHGERDPKAVMAPRPAERLAAMKASGQIPNPDVMRERIAAGDLTGGPSSPRPLAPDALTSLTTKSQQAEIDLMALLLERTATGAYRWLDGTSHRH